MLILKRQAKPGHNEIVIDDQTVITIEKIKGEVVTVGIKAPAHINIRRGELEPKR